MRSILLSAGSLLLGAFPACAATIGISLYEPVGFQEALGSSMAARAKELGFEVKIENAEKSSDNQLASIKGFVDGKVDAIIVAVGDADMGVKFSKLANDAGIPLIYANVIPANFANHTDREVVVASNEKDSGTMETEEICRRLGGTGKVAVLMGELFHPAARTRTQDIHDVLATDACKGLELVEQQSANWNRDDGYIQTKEWLDAGVKFDAVIANNDEMALGAIKALKEAGVSMDDVIVGGVDATTDARNSMAAGDLDVTILQSANGQGAGSIDAAAKLIKGEATDRIIYVPFELVTPENLEKYM